VAANCRGRNQSPDVRRWIQGVPYTRDSEPFTPEQEERYAIRKSIEQAKTPEEGEKIKQDAISNGTLTDADIKTMARKAKEPDRLTYQVKGLQSADDAISVFRVATKEEQSAIYGTILSKIERSESISQKHKDELLGELDKLSKQGIDKSDGEDDTVPKPRSAKRGSRRERKPSRGYSNAE